MDTAFNEIVKKKQDSCKLTFECLFTVSIMACYIHNLLLYCFFLFIGIIAANVFVFCLWRLPGMRRVMFTYFTSDPSSSK